MEGGRELVSEAGKKYRDAERGRRGTQTSRRACLLVCLGDRSEIRTGDREVESEKGEGGGRGG